MEIEDFYNQARRRVEILQRADLLRAFRLRELDDVEAVRFEEKVAHYHHPLSYARPNDELTRMAIQFLERYDPDLKGMEVVVTHRAFLSLLSPHDRRG